jgi:hypothetical protein
MSDVTRILDAIQAGQPQAAEELLPLVYGELRKLAAAKLAHEKPGQTLDATGLAPKNPALASAPTSCCKNSAREAWAPFGRQNKPNQSSVEWP